MATKQNMNQNLNDPRSPSNCPSWYMYVWSWWPYCQSYRFTLENVLQLILWELNDQLVKEVKLPSTNPGLVILFKLIGSFGECVLEIVLLSFFFFFLKKYFMSSLYVCTCKKKNLGWLQRGIWPYEYIVRVLCLTRGHRLCRTICARRRFGGSSQPISCISSSQT